MYPLRLVTWTAVVALVSTLTVGCSSKQQTSDDEPSESNVPEKLPVDSKVARHIFGGQPPIVVRALPEKWESFRESAEKQVPKVEDAPKYGELRGKGPIDMLAETVGMESLPELVDRKRAAWVRIDAVGDAATQRAAKFALPMPETATFPAGYHIRALIPATDPKALAEKLEARADEVGTRARTRFQPDGSFTRMDAIQPRSWSPPEDRIATLLDERAAGKGPEPPRPTPTSVRFVQSDAPFGVYSNLAALQELGFARTALDIGGALGDISPEYRMRVLAEGAAVFRRAQFVNPPSRRSFRDAALTLGTAADSTLVAELDGTRTAYGQNVYDSTRLETEVPTLPAAPFEGTEPVGSASWVLDWSALKESAESGDVAYFGSDGPLHDEAGLADAMRTSGIWGYLGFLAAPEHLAHAMTIAGRDWAAVAPPKVASLRFALADSGGDLPLRAGFIGRFDVADGDRKKAKKRLRETIRAFTQSLSPSVETKFEKGPEGGLDLTAALGLSTEDLTGGDSRKLATGSRAHFELSSLTGLFEGTRTPPTFRAIVGALADAPPIRLRSGSTEAERRVRLTLGENELDAPRPAARYQPTDDRPSTCGAKLLIETQKVLDRLRDSEPGNPEESRRIAEAFDSAVSQCEDEPGFDNEDLEWARGRFRWILAERARTSLSLSIETLKQCNGAGEGDSNERREACDRIERAADSREAYVEETRRRRKLAEQLYEKACNLGDGASCRAMKSRSLPTVPAAK